MSTIPSTIQMSEELEVKYFIQQLFPNFFFKYGIIKGKPAPPDSVPPWGNTTADFIENVSRAIWVHSNVTAIQWIGFIKTHYLRMVSSPEMYVIYVLYACRHAADQCPGVVYLQFLVVCSLVSVISANFYTNGDVSFIEYTPQILTVYFNEIFKKQFYEGGGWNSLEKAMSLGNYESWYVGLQGLLGESTIAQNVFHQLTNQMNTDPEASRLATGLQPGLSVESIKESEVENDRISIMLAHRILPNFSFKTLGTAKECPEPQNVGASRNEKPSTISNETNLRFFYDSQDMLMETSCRVLDSLKFKTKALLAMLCSLSTEK